MVWDSPLTVGEHRECLQCVTVTECIVLKDIGLSPSHYGMNKKGWWGLYVVYQ